MSLIRATKPMDAESIEEAKQLATELWPEIDFETTTVVDLYNLSNIQVPVNPCVVEAEETTPIKCYGDYVLAYDKAINVLVIGYAEDVKRSVIMATLGKVIEQREV